MSAEPADTEITGRHLYQWAHLARLDDLRGHLAHGHADYQPGRRPDLVGRHRNHHQETAR